MDKKECENINESEDTGITTGPKESEKELISIMDKSAEYDSQEKESQNPSTAEEKLEDDEEIESNEEEISPFKFTKSQLITFAIVFIVTIACNLLHSYVLKISTPEYLAEKYIIAKSKQDFAIMQTFFDGDLFDHDYAGIYDHDIFDIDMYNISLNLKYAGDDYIDYVYSFNVVDNDGTYGSDVSLLLHPNKKWFFYDNWIIDPDYAILSDVRIQILESAEATIGSVSLDDLATKIQNGSNGTLIYTLPAMLRGNYKVHINYPFSENLVYILDLDYDSVNKVEAELNAKDAILLEDKAIEVLKTIYNTEVDNGDFDKIYSDLGLTAPNYFNLEQYNMKVNSAFTSIELDTYDLSDITTELSMLMYDEETDIHSCFVTVSGEVSASGTVVDSTSSDPYYNEFSGSISDFTVHFMFDGINWVVSDVKLVYPF